MYSEFFSDEKHLFSNKFFWTVILYKMLKSIENDFLLYKFKETCIHDYMIFCNMISEKFECMCVLCPES